MTNKRAKLHHFVPQTLQRRFLDKFGKIWYSERDQGGKFFQPEARNTSSAFKIRDYYTILEGGRLSDTYETRFYSVQDDFLGRVLDDIHSSLDKLKIPVLSPEPMMALRKVLLHLILRTPEFAKNYDDFEIGKEILEGTLADALDTSVAQEEIDELKAILKSATMVRNHGRTVRVKSQADPSEKIEKVLSEFQLRFAISHGKHSFILSSLVAYRMGNGGHNGFSNPNMEIWLPISEKRALVFVRDPARKIPMINSETRDRMREINNFAVRHSDQVASHSERLLKSLLRI